MVTPPAGCKIGRSVCSSMPHAIARRSVRLSEYRFVKDVASDRCHDETLEL